MVKLKEYKQLAENHTIEKISLPARVYIPLSQHIGKICIPVVKVGDEVMRGQQIARIEAHVTSPIHASISGKVAALQEWPHPVLGRAKAIVIDSDGQDKSCIPSPKSDKEISNLTPEQIRNIVFEAGIVGMGGASFPSHIKLHPPKPVDTLIINGAECEPYLTGDYRLMVEKAKEILQGIALVERCLGVKKVYIAIEDNKPEAIKDFSSELGARRWEVKVLRSEYPQGGERQLIKNVCAKEVPSGKLPFDVGIVVHNVATIFAIYEAVYFNKPLYERVVTVTGSCVKSPKNLLVRIGTPIKELLNACGLIEEPAKIIIGGPMMGLAQYTDEVPVIKSTNGIVVMNKQEAVILQEGFCIRCGSCVRECPAGLMPCMINLASTNEKWELAKSYNCFECIECGLCNYVCPQNINLVHRIKLAKMRIPR